METTIITGVYCLTQFRTTSSHLHRILYAPSLLTSNSFKICHLAHVWNIWSPYWHFQSYLSHVISSGMSQQHDARIRIQLTRRFLTVLPANPWRQIISILDIIIHTAFCRTLISRSLLPVEDVSAIQPRICNIVDEECPYIYSFISANSSLPPFRTAADSIRGNDAKLCLLYFSHRSYEVWTLSRKAWTG